MQRIQKDLDMPTIEDLEHRIARLESLYDDVLKERLTFISQRLDQLYEKTEKSKAEILAKLYEKVTELYEKVERDKTEKRTYKVDDQITCCFSAIIITATWSILSFDLRQEF